MSAVLQFPDSAPERPIQVAPTWDYVRIPVAAAATGLTDKAIRRKIEEGKWLEGREYIRRDGEIYISKRGYERWVAQGQG
jgi:hypothetical protein